MTNRYSLRFLRSIAIVGVFVFGQNALIAQVPVHRALQQQGGSANPGVEPVQSRPYGLTYGEWSARWWQWAFSLPVNATPLFGAAPCSAGQSGPVWFLPGAPVGGPGPDQNCNVPVGKALFVSVINAECSNLEGAGNTEADLRGCADFIGTLIDQGSLKATLDGQPIRSLPQFQVESPLFHFGPLPNNNLITYFCVVQGEGCPAAPAGSVGIAAGVGVYLMLHPLSVGAHTLSFHGEVPAANFIIDTTYKLNVRP